MNILLYSSLCNSYEEISALCHRTSEPVFLTVNGRIELVAMDIDSYNKRIEGLKLREISIEVEEARIAGRCGCTTNEPEKYLDDVIDSIH